MFLFVSFVSVSVCVCVDVFDGANDPSVFPRSSGVVFDLILCIIQGPRTVHGRTFPL